MTLSELPNFTPIHGMTYEMGPFVEANRISWEVPKALLPDLMGGYGWHAQTSYHAIDLYPDRWSVLVPGP